MTVHEFGDRNRPVILLLPGTMCYWRGNFGGVIDALAEDFLVAAVAYTGFDESDSEDFSSVLEETAKIERYVNENYGGSILCAYGSSLGGSFVGQLAARGNIGMKYGILGSSDLDEASPFAAGLMARLMVGVTYNFIHTGSYKTGLMKKRFQSQMADPDPYNRAFVAMTGRDKYDMSFISRESMMNQFRSDLETRLPESIDCEAEIHIFYAEKMGEKYLDRYKKHFKSPIIHTHPLRHEELLGVYPEKWCEEVKSICKV